MISATASSNCSVRQSLAGTRVTMGHRIPAHGAVMMLIAFRLNADSVAVAMRSQSTRGPTSVVRPTRSRSGDESADHFPKNPVPKPLKLPNLTFS